MLIKSQKRLVHITLDEKLLDNACKLQDIVSQIEDITGEKAAEPTLLKRYGILTILADKAKIKILRTLEGIEAIEEDKKKALL